jgi:hypothetical protein
MNEVHGTYHGGRVDLDSPVDWPDGVRVTVLAKHEDFGLSEEDWPDTAQEWTELARKWLALEPPDLVPEDEVEIEAARQSVRDVTLKAVRKQMGIEQ